MHCATVVVIVVPLVLLAAAAATWLAVGSALRPVDDMRAAADAVDVNASNTAPQLAEPPSGDELRRLGQTLNRMLRRLHVAGEQQRSFIADAAHELRSPIASVQTQLEVALSTDTAPDEWPAVARDVLADVQRLSRLADDLALAGAPRQQAAAGSTRPSTSASLRVPAARRFSCRVTRRRCRGCSRTSRRTPAATPPASTCMRRRVDVATCDQSTTTGPGIVAARSRARLRALGAARRGPKQ